MSDSDQIGTEMHQEDDVSNSDNEIEVTAKKVNEMLTTAWLNEKFSPELLETRIELVECMLEQVKELEAGFSEKDKCLSTSLQKVELERVKFVISSYLRERLRKIQENTMYILEQEVKGASKLSREELKFAEEYAASLEKHMTHLVLQHMPSNMRSIDKRKIPKPDMDVYVFAKVNQKQTQIMLDPEDDPLDLEEGSQFITRYNPIAACVEKGSMSLI